MSASNSLAQTPPMGFRTWNEFGLNVNQTMMEAAFRALASTARSVDGKPTSLSQLGYRHAGVDDGWQACGTGAGGGFHNASGYPLVDTTKFPDLRAMTASARTLGVVPGWYANNCHCADHSKTCGASGTAPLGCYGGDVAATIDYGFASLKVDSCGAQKNVSEYAALFNASGVQVLLENCHEGVPVRTPGGTVHCPMNLFRTSSDIRPTYGAILANLLTVIKFNDAQLTGPGCWAYPDMLEIGVSVPQPPGAKHHCATKDVACSMNATEWQSHFSAWAIVSAPLILGFDVRNNAAMDAVWPIISNREVIAINQQWAGDAGSLREQGKEMVTLPNCGHGTPCNHPSWLVWSKQLSLPRNATDATGSRAAVLLMNNAPYPQTVIANLSLILGLGACDDSGGCAVRDAVAREDVALLVGATLSSGATPLAPHASRLFVITSPLPSPPRPPPSPSPSPSPGPGPSPSPPIPPPLPGQNCSWIPGSGLKGGDIAKALKGGTKEACCELCVATEKCVAACWRPTSSSGPPGCHMKSAVHLDPGGKGDADAVVCVPPK